MDHIMQFLHSENKHTYKPYTHLYTCPYTHLQSYALTHEYTQMYKVQTHTYKVHMWGMVVHW